MEVRELNSADRDPWLAMRQLLWPTDPPAELATEMDEFLSEPDRWGLFIAEIEGEAAGFAETQLRETAAGCTSSGVGYLEAWYVYPKYRRQGVGKALVECCEQWARARGATEMASDTTSEYPDSPLAHASLGFIEVKRRFLYRKSL